MSVINQMLRDLEKQQKNKTSLSSSDAPIAVSRPKTMRWVVLVGVLVAVALIWFGFNFMTASGAEKKVEPVVVVPPVEPVKPVQVAPLLISAVEVPNGGDDIWITNLLKLTVNVVGNKAQLSLLFSKFPEYNLLPNGTDNTQLSVIFERTHISADFKVPQLSGSVIKRIRLLPQNETLRLLVALDGRTQIQSLRLIEDSAQRYELLIALENVGPVDIVPEPKLSVPAQSPVTVPAPIAAVPVDDDFKPEVVPYVSKSNNVVRLDRQAFKAGMKQLDNGNTVAAREYFARALELKPTLFEARLQLAKLLIWEQQNDNAQELLQQGLALQPANFKLRKALARVFLEKQQYEEGIKLLQEKPLPAVVNDLEYRALLAVLQQDAGQYNAAAVSYSYLLQVRPNAALWWFGLAVAYDQAENYDQARKAYNQAVALPSLEIKLRNYSNGRLRQL